MRWEKFRIVSRMFKWPLKMTFLKFLAFDSKNQHDINVSSKESCQSEKQLRYHRIEIFYLAFFYYYSQFLKVCHLSTHKIYNYYQIHLICCLFLSIVLQLWPKIVVLVEIGKSYWKKMELLQYRKSKMDDSLPPQLTRDVAPESDSLEGDLEQIQLEYVQRQQYRQNRVETVRHHIEQQMGEEKRIRKSQSIIFYLLNLSILIVLSALNAYILLDLGVNSELKGKLIITFVFSGFLISVISNLQIAPWQEVVKLYFLMDSLVPVLVAAIIGFFSVFNYLSTNQWYEVGFEACYPVFVFYVGGSLRVMIAYEKWERWKVIIYKFAVLSCGLIFFYVGFTYMKGGYKITKGYFPAVEETVKNTIYLYVFGNVDLFFQYFRRISQFDQTDELRYEYQLRSQQEEQHHRIITHEMRRLQEDLKNEELQDRLAVRILSLRRQKQKESVKKEDIKVRV